ncbi:MAG TPA: carboxypeptidase-like regulatory domain-containing protein [Chitinophagaceae bacterium]|nr:carboxypeptidase-like regulatory domain-containing protein [Chitinophagaceae bacterium]
MKIFLQRSVFSLVFILSFIFSIAQKKAYVNGRVVNENEEPVTGVSIVMLGQSRGLVTNDSGQFRMQVPAGKAFALLFTHAGFRTEQRNFLLNENEEETITVLLEKGEGQLQEVIVRDERERRETGLIRPNPKYVINLPSAVTGVESLIKVFVGSNNELTSQYSVRGGSYDENLVYVNDFEIFRPYLVRAGQQEGLSFINPELVRNISFYNGGFQALYGDKMSSVLDIQYKKPRRFGGSAYAGLLEQGVSLEGVAGSGRFTYLIGARNRSNRNLLSRQETRGNYVPSSYDVQALLNWQVSRNWQAELLWNSSRTRFTLVPEFSKLTTSVFSPFFSATLGIDVYFEGRERDEYGTHMLGLALVQRVSSRVRLKWMVSRFSNNESENIDIAGAYLFGERDFDRRNASYGLIVNPLGAGMYHQFARNRLEVTNWSFSHKGNYESGRHALLWGVGYDRTGISDRLQEWEFQDSAGYSLPYHPDMLRLNKVLRSTAVLNAGKISGYFQDNFLLGDSAKAVTVQAGLRFHYNSLNGELLLSPRAGISWKPAWKRDIVLRAAAGAYHQPPFYRELRRYDGSVNTALRAQRSWQGVAGFDYNFIGLGGRPMRWVTEVYYKHMTRVVPYDIDNVRLRYFGENSAKAYAAGLEMRLFGELVRDAESWVSLGIMKTGEDIRGDFFKIYTLDSTNTPIDSSVRENGWLRRPTDRRIMFGMYFQDYLPTNKNFKMFLNLLYGSNLPYNIPGQVRYRNALFIDPYIRCDMGFSALLLSADRSTRRSHSPFRNFESIWASLEVFNVIDRANTISYLQVKDFSNTIFLMPNTLTPRLVNIKLIARW